MATSLDQIAIVPWAILAVLCRATAKSRVLHTHFGAGAINRRLCAIRGSKSDDTLAMQTLRDFRRHWSLKMAIENGIYRGEVEISDSNGGNSRQASIQILKLINFINLRMRLLFTVKIRLFLLN